MQDIGLIGEYFTYQCIAPLNGYKKFIFNCYLPKADGETTEVDVILLHESGIYVFESKNYSGWIFGNESQTFWTQTLPSGKGKSQKSRFFNPIMQNAGHIKQLKAFLASDDLPIYSYVLFSDRCELKNVKLEKRTLSSSTAPMCFHEFRKTMQKREISFPLNRSMQFSKSLSR
ncbi:MAG: nuclease-related domain-containing protein [Christensenellaceae bacterium]